MLVGKYPGDYVAMAFPDDPQHIKRIEAIRTSLDKLRIIVFFVAADRSVRLVGNLPQT